MGELHQGSLVSHLKSACLAKSKTSLEISLDARRYSYGLGVEKEHKKEDKKGKIIATDKEANIEGSCGVFHNIG